jgi:hypothetical protein
MADEKTVTVDLPRARTFRNRAYGPGRAIEVPARVAKALGLEGGKAPKSTKRAKAGK